MVGVQEPARSEQARVEGLLDAQARAAGLFADVVTEGLIRPGASETEISAAIADLAHERYGVTRHWHKRVVRSGANTLLPFAANPPEQVLGEDDVCFLDLGPVFADWEADFGRTYALGADPRRQALVRDLPEVWAAGRAHFDATPDITGAQLYAHMQQLALDAGWEFGGEIAGHMVGEFPHAKVDSTRVHSTILPGNDLQLRGLDSEGRIRHWILEVHLVDRARGFGGFHEELLTI